MRQTPHFAKWQLLRQNNDAKSKQIAEVILRREDLLRAHRQGRPIDWQSFDTLTSQLSGAGFPLPDASAYRSQTTSRSATPSATAEAPSGAAALLHEENLLILSAHCPAVRVNQDILAYGDGQTTLLPLGEVARALDFAITVNAQQQTASGWFMDEQRTLALDLRQKTITIGGTSLPWPDGKIVASKDEIFVDSEVLGQWLPADFKIATGDMALKITPREQLPIQAQAEREKQRSRLLGKEERSIKYPVQETPYELYSVPVMDIALQTGLETGGTSKNNALQLNHSLTAEGDLAHMGAKVFVSGDEDEPLDNARFTLERLDRHAGLLGPMQASKIAVGDVTPVRLPILGSPGVERGVTVANGDIERSRDFDSTRFEGYTQPGWDVELYQNGNLINSVRVGGDGHYLFENVPVYFGGNGFQLVALGPQGQRRMIESRNINVGSGMLKKGEANYTLSATQQRKTVTGLEQNNTDQDRQGKPRLTGQVAYGLNDHLTMSGGFSSIEFDNTLHNYTQVGVSGSLSTLYTELNAVQDSAGGSGYAMQGQAAVGPFNLRARQEFFSDFIDENQPDKILEQRSSLGIYGRIAESLLPPLAYTLSRDHTVYTDEETGRYSARLGGRFGKVYLTNQLNWNDNQAGDKADMDGQFQASGSVGRVRLNAGLDYDLKEGDDLDRYKLSALWSIDRGLSAGADFTQDMDTENRSTARLNLNFDTGKYVLTPSMSYNSDGEFGVFLGLSFSLGQDPINDEMIIKSEKRSGTGSATALVYHDANNNRVFDQNDTPLPEVTVIANQAGKKAQTDAHGMARFTSLRAQSPTDVAIDPDSLEDPSWQPAIAGKAIAARSGATSRLELPVVSTGEVDGTVFLRDKDGRKQPLANARLELKDHEGTTVQSVVSEYDGFYLFEKVLPGTYTLTVDSDQPASRQAASAWRSEVKVGNDGTIVRGHDILLQPFGQGGRGAVTGTPTPAVVAATPPGQAVPAAQPVPSRATSGTPFTLHPLVMAESLPTVANDLPSPQPSTGESAHIYGVQVASYTTLEAAKTGMHILGKRLAGHMDNHRFTVARVDLGPEKGVYYRVIVGEFTTKDGAGQLARQVARKIEGARAVAVDTKTTVPQRQQPAARMLAATGLHASVVAGRYAAMQQAR